MKIALIGRGGHSRVIADMVLYDRENVIIAYLDDQYKEVKQEHGIYLGPVDFANNLLQEAGDVKFIICIGHNGIRKSIYEKLAMDDSRYATIIHHTAVISRSAAIASGTVIMAGAVVNAGAVIGKQTIINTGSIVEHDNNIADFVHISPSATLTGTVGVGEGAHLGAGSVVIPNMQIGAWSMIGAGAVVTREIPAYSTAVGVPARIISSKH